jgi:pimeloyl-ACP methyl ester carboxylesterase
MMAKASQIRSLPEGRPRVRRGYFECRYGQLHVYNAIPPGGGFEERTPLLCLHAAPLSGRIFEGFLTTAGADRSAFAPDLPGFGNSDPPPGRASIADHAAAIGDFLESMRLRQVDVLGSGFGALVALELALERAAQIRRVALMSVPATGESRPGAAGLPESVGPSGAALVQRECARALALCGAAAPPEVIAAAAADALRSAAQAEWAAAAERAYPLRACLGRLAHPVLVLRAADESRDSGARIREALPRARLIELPGHAGSLLTTVPQAAAEALESFLL